MPSAHPSATFAVEDIAQSFETIYQELVTTFPDQYRRLTPLTGLWEDLTEYLARPGKRLRPLILLSGYVLTSKKGALPPPHILRAAAALELFHNFVLAHDDIIDAANTRRGGPSLHRAVEARLHCPERIAEHQAMILGDVVFCFAVDCLNSPEIPHAAQLAAMSQFLKIAQDTGVGEALELLLTSTSLPDVSESSIHEVYHLKTTRYTFEGPLLIGCLLAGADLETSEALASLVHPLGMAFQIENDLHEIEVANPEDPDLGMDLAAGVKTLLLHQAYAQATVEDQQRIMNWIAQATENKQARLDLVHFLGKTPAFDTLKAKSAELFDQAEREIIKAEIDPSVTDGLLALVRFLNKRRYHTQSLRLKS